MISKKLIDIVCDWVHQWYFDVESKEEFDMSKESFDKWLESNKNRLTPEVTARILNWYDKQLHPYEAMWQNYRLHIT